MGSEPPTKTRLTNYNNIQDVLTAGGSASPVYEHKVPFLKRYPGGNVPNLAVNPSQGQPHGARFERSAMLILC